MAELPAYLQQQMTEDHYILLLYAVPLENVATLTEDDIPGWLDSNGTPVDEFEIEFKNGHCFAVR